MFRGYPPRGLDYAQAKAVHTAWGNPLFAESVDMARPNGD
jgi:hypothetical protein